MWSAAACRRFYEGSLLPVDLPCLCDFFGQASLSGASGGKPPHSTWFLAEGSGVEMHPTQHGLLA